MSQHASPASEAFYLPLGVRPDAEGHPVETFTVTEATSSPWGPELQHGGPVSALLTRAMDRCQPREGTRLTRITVELLGPVPVTEVHVSARIERPGRAIELLSAVMQAPGPDGELRSVARAQAWRLATSDTSDVVRRTEPVLPFPEPGEQVPTHFSFPDSWGESGYLRATEWILVNSGGAPGDPTEGWLRLRVPVVAGEVPTPLEKAMALADSANGLGARLDPRKFAFLNTETTIHLPGEPTGDWFGIRSEPSFGSDGIGLTAAVLHAETGPIGRIAQNILVTRVG